MEHTNAVASQNEPIQYFASPGLVEGTWMVIAIRHLRDPGYGVGANFPSERDAEAVAAQLNAALSADQALSR